MASGKRRPEDAPPTGAILTHPPPDHSSVAQQFVEFYYKAFDSDRSHLANVYRDASILIFEQETVTGPQAIVEKLTGLPFQKVQHRVDTLDSQPSNAEGGILVMVTGALIVDDQPHPMNYTQVFNLLKSSGSYYVHNDIFRLIYPV
ncbi:hypothetical protein DV736_g2088, partial [Chaetothyriales sp. CBS 134916]